jgi:hypothetical protein
METLKAGTVVYWNKDGARVYWRTDLNDQVDFLSEEFLQGETNNGHPYSETFADDVPNQGQSIDPSVLDAVAGTITGAIVQESGTFFYPLRFPFTFYNLDGTNHWDSSKSLKVFVNIEDVSVDTSKVRKDRETKKALEALKNSEAESKKDKVDNAKSSTSQSATDTPTKTNWLKIGLISVGFLLVLGAGYWIYHSVTKSKIPVMYQQQEQQQEEYSMYSIPQNRLYPVQT